MSLLGVYVHIPFCLSKCPYCGFNSCASRSIPEDAYVNALLSEIEHVSDKRFSECTVVDTVYFGGGTPSLFSPASIEKVLAAIATMIDGARVYGFLHPLVDTHPVFLDRLRS